MVVKTHTHAFKDIEHHGSEVFVSFSLHEIWVVFTVGEVEPLWSNEVLFLSAVLLEQLL